MGNYKNTLLGKSFEKEIKRTYYSESNREFYEVNNKVNLEDKIDRDKALEICKKCKYKPF